MKKPRRMHWIITGLLVWVVAAYLLAPWAWRQFFRHNPTFDGGPRITHTADGHPGDPLNIALVGSEPDVLRAMHAAGWDPADPITFASSARIVADSILREPDPDAPVSNLLLFGRKEDLAFELPVGDSPRQRHHVRFWLWNEKYDGRDVWVGSASFDERVGLSHTTGQVTHHIAPEVDAERELIMHGLQKAGCAASEFYINGFHKKLDGLNGGGDPWRTDGRLGVVVLSPSR